MIFRPDGPISGPFFDAVNGMFGAISGSLEAIGIPHEQSWLPLSFLSMPFVGSTYVVSAVGS